MASTIASNVEWMEREYNARAAIPDHPQIFARWAEQGAQVRRRRAGLIDMPYGDDEGERLDFFPTVQRNSPLLVFIHGGYWRSLDKSDFSWIAPPFLDAAVAMAFLNYGLAPRVAMEDIVRQQLKAIVWLYTRAEELGFDRQRIVVGGHSAGGHLTAMMMAALWPDAGPGPAGRPGQGRSRHQRPVRPRAAGAVALHQLRPEARRGRPRARFHRCTCLPRPALRC